MNKMTIAVAVLAVLSVVGCQKKQVAVDDSLSRDLTLASSYDGLARVPSVSGHQIMSAVEQQPYKRVSRAPVKRPPKTPRIAEGVPQVVMTPAVAASAPGPVMTAPQPRAVEVSDPVPAPVATSQQPEQSDNHGGGWRGAVRGMGVVIRAGGVVIRGGVGDGDHCDPRANPMPIAINNQMPRFR